MRTGLERGPLQMKSRSASRDRRRQATSTFVDGRGDSALQRRIMKGIDSSSTMQRQRDQLEASFGHPAQRVGDEEEELLQGKFATLQRQGPEEEELLQGKFPQTLQRQELEDEELMQGKFSEPVQRDQEGSATPNQTGMPDNLKRGIESLSGMEMSDVRVHYNSPKPAQLGAHAYAQGKDIHLGAGQEKHLPHEAWHVVQQKQGRVQPTMQMKGNIEVNDDVGLEKEADVMGGKAFRLGNSGIGSIRPRQVSVAGIVQRSEVKVTGGTFKTEEQDGIVKDVGKDPDKLIYAAMKGLFKPSEPDSGTQVGAIMKLKFMPDSSLKPSDMTQPPTRVSLVQTVQDSLKVESKPVDRAAAGFGLRLTEAGMAIDQTLYSDTDTDIENLDPRYSESRMSEEEPLTKAGSSVKGTGGHSVDSDDDSLWTKGALLRDNPGAINPGSLGGGMNFEVAALVEVYNAESKRLEKKFAGSVKWGWKATGKNGLVPKLDPAVLTLGDEGRASEEFFKAVAKWNAMQVPTIKGKPKSDKRTPLQLPGAIGVSEESELREAPKEPLKKKDLETFTKDDAWLTMTAQDLIAALEQIGSIHRAEKGKLEKLKIPAKGMVAKLGVKREMGIIINRLPS